MDVLWLVIPGAVAALVTAVLAVYTLRTRRGLLQASVVGALSALLLVTGWLLTDPGVSKGDALKTGGLAGGAILALYGLWINDRRRKTEEDRKDTEVSRTQQDRERISDERFAKAIELLGHEADQVRVGALHALAGLAQSRPAYTQTVLDVLCSYLRRPFSHPSYKDRPDDPDQEPQSEGELYAYDFEQQRGATLATEIDDFVIGPDARTLVYFSHGKLRAIDAGGDLPEDGDADDKPPQEIGRLPAPVPEFGHDPDVGVLVKQVRRHPGHRTVDGGDNDGFRAELSRSAQHL